MATIHLLDDDTAVTNACAFLLESLGYDVKCWTQGADFLAQASLYQAGVVLLDMRMPVLDGQGVHDALRQCGSTLAVVFLTGHGDVPMAVEQMNKALKKRGFKFVGTTICYSFMQACGLVNDHITGCFCHPGEKHDSQIPE